VSEGTAKERWQPVVLKGVTGGAGRIRTGDLRFRKQRRLVQARSETQLFGLDGSVFTASAKSTTCYGLYRGVFGRSGLNP